MTVTNLVAYRLAYHIRGMAALKRFTYLAAVFGSFSGGLRFDGLTEVAEIHTGA